MISFQYNQLQELWSQNAPDFKSENGQIFSVVKKSKKGHQRTLFGLCLLNPYQISVYGFDKGEKKDIKNRMQSYLPAELLI